MRKVLLWYDEIYTKHNIITENEKDKKSKKISEKASKEKNQYDEKKTHKKEDKKRQEIIRIEKLKLRKKDKKYKHNSKHRKKSFKKFNNKIHSKSMKDSKVILLESNNIEKSILKNLNKKLTIYRYNDNEMNLLDYEEAKKNDKRNYIEYYLSLLKTKHLLFFTFLNFNDYNSSVIKIYIFFFNILIEYTISAMFYTDEAMHKIYEDGGTFDILYQIPQLLYSSLLSLLFTNLISYLGLYEDNILNIKNSKFFLNKKRLRKIRKCLKIKIIIFFITTYILLFCFWVYVGCFCVVYKNTQIHLLTEVISSFGVSLIIPLFIYLIPGIFRIPSLKGRKRNKPLLFKFSKILQNLL